MVPWPAHNEIPHLVSLLATSQCKRMDQRLAGQVTFRFPVKNLNFQFNYNQINLVFSVEKNSIRHLWFKVFNSKKAMCKVGSDNGFTGSPLLTMGSSTQGGGASRLPREHLFKDGCFLSSVMPGKEISS